MIRKLTGAVADGAGTRVANDEASHGEIFRRACRRECGHGGGGAIFGREIGGAVEPRVHWRVRLLRQLAEILGVFRCQARERLRLLDGATQSLVAAIVGDHAGLAFAEHALNADRAVGGHARRGHLIVGKAQIRFARAVHRHPHGVGLGQLHRAFHDGLRLVAREHADGGHGFRVAHGLAHTVRPVLMMFAFLKRVGGQPWLTALAWPGWPLPSLKVPPNS